MLLLLRPITQVYLPRDFFAIYWSHSHKSGLCLIHPFSTLYHPLFLNLSYKLRCCLLMTGFLSVLFFLSLACLFVYSIVGLLFVLFFVFGLFVCLFVCFCLFVLLLVFFFVSLFVIFLFICQSPRKKFFF